MPRKDKAKILIVKLGAIGDVVMALSMLHEIDLKYPEAEITWICGQTASPIIKSIERINHKIIIDDSKLLKGNLLDQVNVIFDVWSQLFLKKFNLVIVAYKDKRYSLLTLPVIKKSYRNFFGTHRANMIIPGRYHAVEYARLINNVDDFQITNPVIPKLNLLPNIEFQNFIKSIAGMKIILTPGGAQNLINDGWQRRWPIESYVNLAEKLLKTNLDFSVLLAGSKDDIWAEKYFEHLPVINLLGKTTLHELIYLYNNSSVLITHDTGIMHLAKLTTIKTIALFGPVNPSERIGMNEDIFCFWIGNTLPCSPCYDGKAFADCKDNICMKNISVSIVFDKALEILNNKQIP